MQEQPTFSDTTTRSRTSIKHQSRRHWIQPSVIPEEPAYPTLSSIPSTRQKEPPASVLSELIIAPHAQAKPAIARRPSFLGHAVKSIAEDLVLRTVRLTLNGKSWSEPPTEQDVTDSVSSSRFSPWRSPRSPEVIQGEPYISSPSDQMEPPPSRHYTTHSRNDVIRQDDNSTIVAGIQHAPTAWGANFWVVLADPVTEHSFYACPATGDCSWDPPVHAMVLPRNAAVLRNTPRSIPPLSTGTAAQTPPLAVHRSSDNDCEGPRTPFSRGADVKDHDVHDACDEAAAIDVDLAQKKNHSVFPALTSQYIAQVGPPRTLSTRHPEQTRTEENTWMRKDPERRFTTGFKFPMFVGPSGSGAAGATMWMGKRLPPDPIHRAAPASAVVSPVLADVQMAHGAFAPVPEQQEVSYAQSKYQSMGTRCGSTVISEESPSLAGRSSAFAHHNEDLVDSSFRTASLASGTAKLVPSAVVDDSRYPNEYFAVHRKGIARRRLTGQELMQWQSRPFTGPLLAKTTALSAVECPKIFIVIQHTMGERDSPVEGIVPPKPSEAVTRLLARQKSGIAVEERDHSWGKVERTMLLDEVRWLVHIAIRYPDLRDEVYAMTIKQEAAFIGSIFGESLQTVMHQQAEHFPHLRVPGVLAQSAKAILQSGGLNTAGIFLTMGDPDVVSEVRARFDRYQDGLNVVSGTACLSQAQLT
ncbi:hypothetical protein QFC22_001739 [Naganishia vaughanmartiniae]|uniref:Uncharacterized protein n=1 Tax=Naganishia vaughanmartiniae TaxID=1424756 RepID=A0ACC2XE51_9TREE|nr:hypothetical protein QFC22_001739 [Naganishia vaughanmartiniae]